MRKILTAAIAATLLLAAAQPAAAIERTYSVQSTTTDASGNRLNQGANARVLNGDVTTVNIHVECFANTSPPAISIGLQDCYIVGADGTEYEVITAGAHPGPVTIATDVFRTVPRQHYRVCVDSNAFFSEDNNWVDAPLVCSA
jgi:type 1 fimbria pilin